MQAQEIDTHIFKEFLQYDLTSGSLWEIVEIFERHRKEFRTQVAQYNQDIQNAKTELKVLREKITQSKKILQDLTQKLAQLTNANPKADTKTTLSTKSKENTQQDSLPRTKKPSKKQVDNQEILKSRILALELENKRLKVELRDLKQEVEIEKRETSAPKTKKAK